MKKKILYLFAFSIILFGLNYNNVMAEQDYNGVSTDDIGTGIGSCPNGLCMYNNSNEMAVEVTISYIANGGREDYHTEVWTNNKAANGTVTSNGSIMVYKDFLPTGGDNYTAMQQAVESHFMSNNGLNAMDWYSKYANTSLETQDSNPNNPASLGTRIITTPVLSTLDHGQYSHLTVKEVAERFDQLTNKSRFEAIAKLFYTEYTDVGIESLSPAQMEAMTREMLAMLVANGWYGAGMNIIDFMKGLKFPGVKKPAPACPGGSMNLSNPSANCNSAIGGLTYSYSYTAGGGSQSNVHRKYGLDQNAPGTGAYCKLYCQEYGTATLPGGLADAVQLGSYIIWPTSSSNTTNKFPKADNYPLKFSGKKSCKLVLMPDHNNFPGNGCLQDPVAEYMCIYNASTVAGSKYVCGRTYNSSIRHIGLEANDYDGVHYETVRTANGNYFNEPEYCGDKKRTTGEVARCTTRSEEWAKYTVDPKDKYYNSGKRLSDYLEKTNAINKAANDAMNACNAYSKGDEQLASEDRQCWHSYGGSNTNAGGYYSLCDDIVAAQEKREAYNKAKQAYNDAINATKNIENSIDACKSYITDFNYARNILNEIGLCGNFSASGEDYYHFSSKASMSYNNGEYSVSGNLSKESSATIGCSGQCGGLSFKEKPDYTSFATMDTPAILAGKVSQIENRTIVFTADSDVYKSNSNYSYVDKKKNKYSKSQLDSNYLEIKSINGGLAKVLPTDYNVDILDSNKNAIKYTLNLKDTAFGENNRFNVTNSGDYVCKYEMAKKNDGCICPQDSKMPGKDLMKHVAEDPISCADAQQKYCDNGPEEPYDKLYCPDMQTPLTSCLKTGIGYQKCVDLVCPGTYKCKNTNGLRTGMDITDCVQTKLAQGLTVEQALNYCDSVVCPIGKSIIYRTIKLENPFPGKDISKIVSGFNNDVKGRYPGTNWNGVLTVYNKIRNNREHDTDSQAIATNTNSTSGTTIYQTKKPLYTFVLNGVTIKNIRDYNEKQKDGYNDFKLECKTNHSSGCISEFVHNINLSGLTSGTCQNISLDNSFYTCAE